MEEEEEAEEKFAVRPGEPPEQTIRRLQAELKKEKAWEERYRSRHNYWKNRAEALHEKRTAEKERK